MATLETKQLLRPTDKEHRGEQEEVEEEYEDEEEGRSVEALFSCFPVTSPPLLFGQLTTSFMCVCVQVCVGKKIRPTLSKTFPLCFANFNLLISFLK